MKILQKTSILLLFALLCFSAFGQTQEATTGNGKKVILNPDGTWKYVESEKKTPAAEQELSDVLTDEQSDDEDDKLANLKDIFVTPPRKATGKVIDVHDGDTLTLLDDKKEKYKVRFNGIDAPELKQDFGNRSQQNLAKMVAGKNANIVCPKVDKYGRNVCTVFLDGIDINLEQIKGGYAWHYKKYQDEQTPEDRKDYSEAEINARQQKLGLWLQPNAIEPSAWRRGEGNPNTAGVPKGAIIGNKNSMIYHTPGCSTYAKVSPKNQTIFADEKEAIAKGYRLSGGCESTLKVEERPKPTPKPSATEAKTESKNVSKPKTDRIYETGAKGGCFYLNPSGKKVYVDKSFCKN